MTRNKQWAIMGVTALILIGVGTIFCALNAIYFHPQDRPWVRHVVSALSLPAARLRDERIAYSEYLAQQDAMRAFLQSPEVQGQGAPTQVDAGVKRAILDQLLRAAAMEVMAKQAHISLTSADIDRAYEALINRAGTSTEPGEVATYLRETFGWTEADFKQRAVRPATLEQAVRQEVYQDNDENFDKALQDLLKEAVIYVKDN